MIGRRDTPSGLRDGATAQCRLIGRCCGLVGRCFGLVGHCFGLVGRAEKRFGLIVRGGGRLDGTGCGNRSLAVGTSAGSSGSARGSTEFTQAWLRVKVRYA